MPNYTALPITVKPERPPRTFALFFADNLVAAKLELSGFGIGRHVGQIAWTGDGRHYSPVAWMGDAVTIKFPALPTDLLVRLDGVEFRVTKGQ